MTRISDYTNWQKKAYLLRHRIMGCNVSTPRRTSDTIGPDTDMKKNRFYHSPVHVKETNTLQINSSKAFKKTVRCGTVMHHGKLALLTQLFYQDKHCDCCNNTYRWKLCFLHDKPLYITKRHHSADDSHVFPGDMCYVEKERYLYLTLPWQRMVYKLPETENFHEAFQTHGRCFGITQVNGGLALSIEIPTYFEISVWEIQIVDLKGKVLRRIEHDSNGGALFVEPLFLTSSKDGNILFVSDHGKNSVLVFGANGRLMFEYDRLTVITPLGIAVDMYNNMYVACGTKILQIEAGGVSCKNLLEVYGKDRIVGVCMDFDTNTLFSISELGKVSSYGFENIG